MECSGEERRRLDFKKTREADDAQILKGNYNFKGIGPGK